MKKIMTKTAVFIMIIAALFSFTPANVFADEAGSLSIITTLDKLTVSKGENLTLTFSVSHTHSQAITNVQIIKVDTNFFSKFEFVDGSVTLNGVKSDSYTWRTGQLTLTAPQINPGETAHLSFQVTASEDTESDVPNGRYSYFDSDGVNHKGIGGETEVIIKGAKYKLAYDANGGTGDAPEAAEFEQDADVVISNNMFTAPENKSFKEWNTQKDGNGTAYAAGSAFKMPEEDVVLYAVWEDVKVIEEPKPSAPDANDSNQIPNSTTETTSNPKTDDSGFLTVCVLFMAGSLGMMVLIMRRKKLSAE